MKSEGIVLRRDGNLNEDRRWEGAKNIEVGGPVEEKTGRVVFFPSFEEGALRPINKCHATFRQGAAGEVSLTSPAALIR